MVVHTRIQFWPVLTLDISVQNLRSKFVKSGYGIGLVMQPLPMKYLPVRRLRQIVGPLAELRLASLGTNIPKRFESMR